MLNCNIIVSKFKLQSYFHVHFQTNTLGKCKKNLILTSYRLSSTTTVLLQNNFGIK